MSIIKSAIKNLAKNTALRALTRVSLFTLGFISLNACQPPTAFLTKPGLDADRALASADALAQAERFWPLKSLQAQSLQVAVLPASSSLIPAGAIGVQLQFSTTAPAAASATDYRLQTNQPGEAAATLSDVMALRLFLVDGSLGLPTGNIMPFPGGGDIFTVSTVSSNQNILFTQVPTGTYYVCVAAFSSSTGPFLPAANLTSTTGGAVYGEGNVRCSDSGGNGDGSISVGAAPTYSVSNTAPLGVNLNLKSATGARIEFNATVTDG